MQRFTVAPWSLSLKLRTAFSLIILCAIPLLLIPQMPAPPFVDPMMWLVCGAVTIGSLLYVITGYELGAQELAVCRLLWRTRLDLRGLSRVYHDPDALHDSWRVFGNGGLFSFSGLFYNRRLGRYRIFGTDRSLAVVMVLPGRTVVVTPADPRAFIAALQWTRGRETWTIPTP